LAPAKCQLVVLVPVVTPPVGLLVSCAPWYASDYLNKYASVVIMGKKSVKCHRIYIGTISIHKQYITREVVKLFVYQVHLLEPK
jgi:hypothetical protein